MTDRDLHHASLTEIKMDCTKKLSSLSEEENKVEKLILAHRKKIKACTLMRTSHPEELSLHEELKKRIEVSEQTIQYLKESKPKSDQVMKDVYKGMIELCNKGLQSLASRSQPTISVFEAGRLPSGEGDAGVVTVELDPGYKTPLRSTTRSTTAVGEGAESSSRPSGNRTAGGKNSTPQSRRRRRRPRTASLQGSSPGRQSKRPRTSDEKKKDGGGDVDPQDAQDAQDGSATSPGGDGSETDTEREDNAASEEEGEWKADMNSEEFDKYKTEQFKILVKAIAKDKAATFEKVFHALQKDNVNGHGRLTCEWITQMQHYNKTFLMKLADTSPTQFRKIKPFLETLHKYGHGVYEKINGIRIFYPQNNSVKHPYTAATLAIKKKNLAVLKYILEHFTPRKGKVAQWHLVGRIQNEFAQDYLTEALVHTSDEIRDYLAENCDEQVHKILNKALAMGENG